MKTLESITNLFKANSEEKNTGIRPEISDLLADADDNRLRQYIEKPDIYGAYRTEKLQALKKIIEECGDPTLLDEEIMSALSVNKLFSGQTKLYITGERNIDQHMVSALGRYFEPKYFKLSEDDDKKEEGKEGLIKHIGYTTDFLSWRGRKDYLEDKTGIVYNGKRLTPDDMPEYTEELNEKSAPKDLKQALYSDRADEVEAWINTAMEKDKFEEAGKYTYVPGAENRDGFFRDRLKEVKLFRQYEKIKETGVGGIEKISHFKIALDFGKIRTAELWLEDIEEKGIYKNLKRGDGEFERVVRHRRKELNAAKEGDLE